ncbi:hypothetical protein CUJ91_31575 (plasmid) [Paraburkholderia graminis]|uniref:LysR family transcriptional regulator n=1 Tax=Paraburkholderia graminis TaxID=60548 RepID=UPI000DEFC740|nr:LysR family transcriptional regulator [Paraburkholderia graminis]AXF12559.1 hypothetical protein CUJ91_31575 [Paraburkholderia graminis]
MKSTPKISLELLELYVAVVRDGTISAAARKLAIAPSLAARKIAALERELNARLFDRTSKKVLLTEAGIAAHAWAVQVLASHDILEDELSLSQGQIKGTLTLVINEYLCTAILPPFLAQFSRKYPDIKFVVRMTDELVSSNDRDFDVAVHTGRIPDSSLRGLRIKDLQRILCASPLYLKSNGTPRRLEDLATHECLVHVQTPNGLWTFEQDGVLLKQQIHQSVMANSYLPLIKFACQGMGIIRVSQGSVREHLNSGELVQILPECNCVHPDGSVPATWVLFPDGRTLERTRVFVNEFSDYLRQHVSIAEG